MEKVYAVAIRWVGSAPSPIRIDHALSPVADWFRYNAETWFVSTNNPTMVQDAVQRVLSTNDSVLVIRVDPYDAHGWAPPEMWNWLTTKRDPLVNALARG